MQSQSNHKVYFVDIQQTDMSLYGKANAHKISQNKSEETKLGRCPITQFQDLI